LIQGDRRKPRALATSFCHLLELSAADFQRMILDAPQLVGRFERLAGDRLPSREVVAEQDDGEDGETAEMRYVTATPEPPFRIADETRDRVSEER
jgi:monovalent cation:H+ antiporter, CPA1 family